VILTVEEFRSLSDSALEDDALQLVLDAAEQEIVRAAGAADSATELLTVNVHQVALSRKAESITSISEQRSPWSVPLLLAADDYRLHPDGYVVERLNTGTNPRWRWSGRIEVAYVPFDDDAIRASVQRDLVTLMETYAPGVTQETVGAWSRTLASNSVWNQNEERKSVLARLSGGPKMLVVGG
jgi:hypothetical protein